jgi:aminoglycoside 3-N-acetyltransferase
MNKFKKDLTPKELADELASCIGELELDKGNNLYITGDLGALGKIRIRKSIKQEIFLKSFTNSIGLNGTIFSPSASMNLCNTDIPFDIDLTPSYEMGSLAEYIRKLPQSIRSLHPFWSITGIGPEAERLKKLSSHSYGLGSAWSHFLELDVTQVNMGIDPSRAVTLIHHIETIVGVPYRYTKEFIHPIVYGDEIKYKPFHQSVFYADSDAKKRVLLNQHYFKELNYRGLLKTSEHSTGLKFTAFKMRDFYNVATEFFIEDIYNYLEESPKIKPYLT